MSDVPELYNNKEAFMSQMEELRPDLMYPESWDSDKVDMANKAVGKTSVIKQMFSAIPMRCMGDKCPMRRACPLYNEGIAPVGSKCPIELRLIRDMSQSLGESLAIDFDDFTEISQLRVIVNQEIQLMRAASYIAEEGFIMENVVGISSDGEAIYKKEMSLAVELEDRIHKRLKDHRAQLLATRMDRAKVNQGEVDSAKAVAKILKEVAVLNAEKERQLSHAIGDVLEEDIIDVESME
jgi:hypothetical protein